MRQWVIERNGLNLDGRNGLKTSNCLTDWLVHSLLKREDRTVTYLRDIDDVGLIGESRNLFWNCKRSTKDKKRGEFKFVTSS